MFKSLNDRAFIVGGSCRDEILGIRPKDFDYAIENCSLEEFVSVFPDAKRVGNKEHSPPVFLINGAEVALCRNEHSTGAGYSDFDFKVGVSIYEDLARRDFSINSLAKKYTNGIIIDPYGGIKDIQNKIIRCLDPQNLKDDPLRILRGIRFAVRFGFSIEPVTFSMMKEYSSYLQYINYDRVQLELQKVYNECNKPSEFFRILDSIGGMGWHFEELVEAKNVLAGKPEHHPEGSVFNHLLNSFDNAKATECSFPAAIASLVHDFGKILTPKEEADLGKHHGHENRTRVLEDFFLRHRFDNYTMSLAKTVHLNHMRWHVICDIKKHVKLIRFVRSIRKNFREDFVKACNCDSELSDGQKYLWYSAVRAIEESEINIFQEIQSKGKDAITSYIECIYVKKLKELINEV